MLGICGFSGSGKTTLIEQLLEAMKDDGLAIGVVKHHHHAIEMDKPGSDTDRFFRAGATVVSHDGDCVRLRTRPSEADNHLADALRWLTDSCQLVLVEGFKGSEIPKIWLCRQGESGPPGSLSNVIAVLGWPEDRLGSALAIVRRRLPKQARDR